MSETIGTVGSTVSKRVLPRTESSGNERDKFEQDKNNMNGYDWIFGKTNSNLSIEDRLNRGIK